MNIPTKIDKRTFTRLSKQNYKYLLGMIADQNHDLLIEAKYMDDYDPDNKYMVVTADEYKETVDSYHKEVKHAFKDFKRDKVKLNKAYAKYVATKK